MPDASAEAKSAAMTAADIHAAIIAAWRIEQPRLITSLARMLRDVPLAEELTQDALLAALERWPVTGVPERPGAWLMATAKRRALDHLRRGPMLERKHEMIAREIEAEQQAMPDLDSGPGRRHRRRDASSHLHSLSSAPVARGTGGLGAPDDLRPDNRGDRQGLSAVGDDDRPAHREGKTDPLGFGAGLRNAPRRRPVGAAL